MRSASVADRHAALRPSARDRCFGRCRAGLEQYRVGDVRVAPEEAWVSKPRYEHHDDPQEQGTDPDHYRGPEPEDRLRIAGVRLLVVDEGLDEDSCEHRPAEERQ